MGYLFFWNIRFFFSFISSSNKCALVMSNHLFPLFNISCLKEFYATISAVYSLLHLLRPVNWLGQEITPESFLRNGWCFLTGSTFEVVSLHLNWKVCHWTIEVCDSWGGSAVNKRDSLRESSKCAPFCQRKCGVFYGKFEVQHISFHRTRFFFFFYKVLFHTGQGFIYSMYFCSVERTNP